MSEPLLQLLLIQKWRQFEIIKLRFHPRLTVLTGVNGSGKTSILSIIGWTTGWSPNFISTLRVGESGLFYSADVRSGYESMTADGQYIGSLDYGSKGTVTFRTKPKAEGGTYNLHCGGHNFAGAPGVYIPSHRTPYKYKAMDVIPAKPLTAAQAWQVVSHSFKIRMLEGSTDIYNFRMKEILVGLAVFGEGNSAVFPTTEAKQLFDDFNKVLKAVLPESLRFKQLIVRAPEVLLLCDSGIEFSLDAVSGGIACLIDLAWHIFFYSNNQEEFFVCIDEPENHLHPAMQRQVLPNLLKAFPQAQFVVSTHSPLVATSVRDSNIYKLDVNEAGYVFSEELTQDNIVRGPSEALRDLLDVPFSLPLWVGEELSKLTKKYSKSKITNSNLQELRQDMKELGLEEYFPSFLPRMFEERDE